MKNVILLLSLAAFSITAYSQATSTDGCYLDNGTAFFINPTTTQAGTNPNRGFVWNTPLALINTSSCPRVGSLSGSTQTSTICYGPTPGTLAQRKGRVYTNVGIENCPIDDGIPLLCAIAGGLSFFYIRNKNRLK